MVNASSNLLRVIVGTTVLFAADAVANAPPDLISLIERLGLAIVLVGFFVWTGWQREKRMATRIDFLDKTIATSNAKIAALTEKVNASLEEENKVLEAAIASQGKLAAVLDGRTCMAFQDNKEFREFQAWKKKRDGDNPDSTPAFGILAQAK